MTSQNLKKIILVSKIIIIFLIITSPISAIIDFQKSAAAGTGYLHDFLMARAIKNTVLTLIYIIIFLTLRKKIN